MACVEWRDHGVLEMAFKFQGRSMTQLAKTNVFETQSMSVIWAANPIIVASYKLVCVFFCRLKSTVKSWTIYFIMWTCQRMEWPSEDRPFVSSGQFSSQWEVDSLTLGTELPLPVNHPSTTHSVTHLDKMALEKSYAHVFMWKHIFCKLIIN